MGEQGERYEFTSIETYRERARDRGAKRIETRGVQWHPELGMFQATATIITAADLEVRCDGYAAPGDMRHPEAAARDADNDYPRRAEKRALAAAIRIAYPDGSDGSDEGQPDYQKHLQIAIRSAAEALGLDRDDLASTLAGMFGVGSTALLDQPQASAAVAYLHDQVGRA